MDRRPEPGTQTSTKCCRQSGIGRGGCPSTAAHSRALALGICPCGHRNVARKRTLPTKPGYRAGCWCRCEDSCHSQAPPTGILCNARTFPSSQRRGADLTGSRSDEPVLQAQGAEGACLECGRVRPSGCIKRQIVRGSTSWERQDNLCCGEERGGLFFRGLSQTGREVQSWG